MSGAADSVDVVIVGGGIAGCALAVKLAEAGFSVVLLEKSTRFRDHVRGEALLPWGVAEARELGLEQALLAAGGGYAGALVACGDGVSYHEAAQSAVDLSKAVPGVPGALNVGHPDACEALLHSAETAGAQILRGVVDIEIPAGEEGAIRFAVARRKRRLRCRIVVGADGRRSAVRRQTGLRLMSSTPRTYGAGLLLGGLPWPTGENAGGTEGDLHYLAFPRESGVVRTYLFWDAARGNLVSGSSSAQDYLHLLSSQFLPDGCDLGGAAPKGPCAAFPMNDSRCDHINPPGAVLVGDAAGWSDPLIGQGLSIALRDARMVAETLIWNRNWHPDIFRGYCAERAERMRRLHISARLATELRCGFTAEARNRRRKWNEEVQRDVRLSGPLLGNLAGPETVAAEAYDPSVIRRILALGEY